MEEKRFNEAMRKYHENKIYALTYKLVSTFNITMQFLLLASIFTFNLPWYHYLLTVILAYLLADFINGLVHMYMDNNEDYSSIFAPFIASFHLHHHTPKYRDSNIFLIYFNESGPKFWLVPYLAVVAILSYLHCNETFLLLAIFFAIFSSVAEVSHYLCHNSSASWVLFLQKLHILLPKEHHKKHHSSDNQSYAFLNGISDPLIDKIAKKMYAGYKNGTDLHYASYKGPNSKNRNS